VPSSYKLYNYDALLRLTEEHKRSADDASLYRYAYTYDAAGNRTQLVNFTGSATLTTTYGYNNGNQLTSSNLSGVGTSTYSYDSNGNMVYSEDPNIGASEYNHNRENRLVRYDRDDFGGDVKYTYDALGRRIMRTDPQGNKLRYWYDGLGILLTKEKPSGASAWRTKQVYTLKQAALGHIISERTNTAWNAQGAPTAWSDKWFHFDLLGNTTGEIGPDGSVTTQVDMEAFGTVLSGGQNGYRLTTKQYDPDAGLYYFNARWYDPNMPRFISPAKAKNHIEHTYTFAGQAASAVTDPAGYFTGDAVDSAARECENLQPCREPIATKPQRPVDGNNCTAFVCCVLRKLIGEGPLDGSPAQDYPGPGGYENPIPPGHIICYGEGGKSEHCNPHSACTGPSPGIIHMGIVGSGGRMWECTERDGPRESPGLPPSRGGKPPILIH
jgi:RHS repeat-associated protein